MAVTAYLNAALDEFMIFRRTLTAAEIAVIYNAGTGRSFTVVNGSSGVTLPVSLANGGSGVDLSATGGAHQFVKQTSAGGVLTVSALGSNDIPSAAMPALTGAVTSSAGSVATAITNGFVVGAGTSYTLTGSAAAVTFGTTSPVLTSLPAGTYLLFYALEYSTGGILNDEYEAHLFDTGASAIVPGSRTLYTQLEAATNPQSMSWCGIYTVSGTPNIQLRAFNTDVHGTVTSTLTSIGYVRLA